ncbi:MAG TPA: WecB/TagA/CpsF family glycosyltransferase [Candidatus Hydrogenedentes bacterium]|nr:WecB/TagA/CpsF family glycosyltransferase [Candidatus Hydrogenedentota bacterium]
MNDDAPGIPWPVRHNVLGVRVSATTYDAMLDVVLHAARARQSSCVSHLAVHGLVEGSRDPEFRAVLDAFDIVAPDGHPVRHALNLLYHAGLSDRCYGPEFTLRVCEQAAREGIGVYLYGSQPHVVEAMRDALVTRFPGLRVVGCEPSLFRTLTPAEEDALARRVNDSGAGVMFIGLGCPLQERFAHVFKGRITAVMLCVGAAFDFHAGTKKMAPAWMQRHSLEWLYRLLQEPRRLWRRYFIYNSVFLWRLALQYCGLRKYRPDA